MINGQLSDRSLYRVSASARIFIGSEVEKRIFGPTIESHRDAISSKILSEQVFFVINLALIANISHNLARLRPMDAP